MKLFCKWLGHKITESWAKKEEGFTWCEHYCRRCKVRYYQTDIRNPFFLSKSEFDEWRNGKIFFKTPQELTSQCCFECNAKNGRVCSNCKSYLEPKIKCVNCDQSKVGFTP